MDTTWTINIISINKYKYRDPEKLKMEDFYVYVFKLGNYKIYPGLIHLLIHKNPSLHLTESQFESKLLQKKMNRQTKVFLTLICAILNWVSSADSRLCCAMSFSSGITAEAVRPPCNEDLFDINVDNCLSDFNKSMETSDYQNMCPWPMVQR